MPKWCQSLRVLESSDARSENLCVCSIDWRMALRRRIVQECTPWNRRWLHRVQSSSTKTAQRGRVLRGYFESLRNPKVVRNRMVGREPRFQR